MPYPVDLMQGETDVTDVAKDVKTIVVIVDFVDADKTAVTSTILFATLG